MADGGDGRRARAGARGRRPVPASALTPASAATWWQLHVLLLPVPLLGGVVWLLAVYGVHAFLVDAIATGIALIRRDGLPAFPGALLFIAAAVPFLQAHIY